MFEVFGNLSTAEWIVVGAVWLTTHVLVYIAFTRWFLGRQWRLYRNLKRPVIVLPPIMPGGGIAEGCEMRKELDLLQRSGLFNLKADGDYTTFNPSEKHCVVVLCYYAGMMGLDDVLAKVKAHHAPVIIYTFGKRLSENDQKKVDEYPSAVPANYPLALLNSIFATVACYPYDK